MKSKFLSSFLAAKRVCEVPPPAEIIGISDEYLREFAHSARVEHSTTKSLLDNGDSDSDIEEHYTIDRETNPTSPPSSSAISGTADCLSGDVPNINFVMLKLKNLPFTMSADAISKLVHAKLGLVFEKVTIDREAKTNRPAGTATLTLPLGSDSSAYLSGLPTIEFGGRKVSTFDIDKGERSLRRSAADGRYFGHDSGAISTSKCFLCGEPGHKQSECMNDPLPVPCHLCAGLDHDAQACPNVKCFRCGRFGHRNNNCVNYKRYSPVIVCSRCGSNEHESNVCSAKSKRIMDTNSAIRCIVCGKHGHTVCGQPKEKIQTSDAVFCPNCGQEGHHIDYATTCEDEYCTVPKYEAHTRYSMLTDMLKDIDVCAVDRSRSMRHLNNIYNGLIGSIWSKSEYERVQALFPSLLHERDREQANRHMPQIQPANRRKTFGGQSSSVRSNDFLAGMDEVLPSSGFGRKRGRESEDSPRPDKGMRRSATPQAGERRRESDRGVNEGDSRCGYDRGHASGDYSQRANSVQRGGGRVMYPGGTSTSDVINMYKSSGSRTKSRKGNIISEVNMGEY